MKAPAAASCEPRVLVRGEQTGGRFAVVEVCRERGAAPPLRHLHTRESELIYVLEGRISVQRGDESVSCAAGDVAFLPPGDEHSHLVVTDRARLLVIIVPAGLEAYFDDPAPGGAQQIEALVGRAARFGVAITGVADTGSDE